MNSILKRIRDQVNPFDGGKTFNSPQQRQTPMVDIVKQIPQMQQFERPALEQLPQQGFRSQPEIRGSAPLMFEDQSFQGSPYLLQPTNPGYTFYEDNTFSTPQQNPYSRLRKLLGR